MVTSWNQVLNVELKEKIMNPTATILEPNEQKTQIINPIERPQITQELSENIILTTVDDLYNWARLSSLWPLMFGTACCFIEMAAFFAARFDFERFGFKPWPSPRHADVIITAGTITMKMAPALVRLYEQMPEPKYVIAMGACTITGGMFSSDSPTAVRGVDKLIPVDVYLPGCPPRPEAIIDAIIKLRKKVAQESIQEQGAFSQSHRYYSITHKMKPAPPLYSGEYLESSSRNNPPEELAKMIKEASSVMFPSLPEKNQSKI
jgi:NAD(P)H-quinone oxidoreductase subunit K